MEQESCTRAEAQDKIFSDGLRIYSTLDQKAQSAMEQVMLNEDTGDGELFPALWHEEEVSSSIPADSEITYDESGLPLNPDGSSVFTDDDVPVYADKEHKTLVKTESVDFPYVKTAKGWRFSYFESLK